jgi:hypothetical protein
VFKVVPNLRSEGMEFDRAIPADDMTTTDIITKFPIRYKTPESDSEKTRVECCK